MPIKLIMMIRVKRATIMWLNPLMWAPLVRFDWVFMRFIAENIIHLWLDGVAHVEPVNRRSVK